MATRREWSNPAPGVQRTPMTWDRLDLGRDSPGMGGRRPGAITPPGRAMSSTEQWLQSELQFVGGESLDGELLAALSSTGSEVDLTPPKVEQTGQQIDQGGVGRSVFRGGGDGELEAAQVFPHEFFLPGTRLGVNRQQHACRDGPEGDHAKTSETTCPSLTVGRSGRP